MLNKAAKQARSEGRSFFLASAWGLWNREVSNVTTTTMDLEWVPASVVSGQSLLGGLSDSETADPKRA